jgi:signal transduction histidine kinase/ligand-binding sensor domain-containing protein/CheY-like chemotaxis protein
MNKYTSKHAFTYSNKLRAFFIYILKYLNTLRLMAKFVSFIYLFLIPLLSFSQEKQYLFSNINKSQGLSHNHTQCFLKDRKGFVWIGTIEGLCRFDGYSFKIFKNDPNDSASLRDNTINNLFEDKNGKIWIATGNYFDIFNPETETFTHKQSLFNNRIQIPIGSKWYQQYDNDGNLWYANNKTGLYKYTENSNSVKKIKLDCNSTNKTITWMDIDKKGNIWIALNNSIIYMLNSRNYRISDSISMIKKYDNSYQFFIDKDNDIWIYDKNNASGVFFYNFKYDKLMQFTTKNSRGRLNNDAITGILEDDNGLIWISTDHGGVNILNKTDFSVQYITNNPLNERSICDNSITNIFKDYQGFIWMGTYKNGFSYYHNHLFNFNLFKIKLDNSKVSGYNDIDNFAEDKKGNLWIGTNGGGLIYFDRKNNSFKQYINEPDNPSSIGANIIIGMNMDKKDRLWIGTYFGGLNLFDGSKFQQFKNDPSNPFTISDDRVWDICEDSNGKIWVATLLGGINVFDPVKKVVTEHFQGKQSPFRSNAIFSVIEGRDNILWFATVNGLRSYDQRTRTFENYKHDDKNPNTLSKNFVYDVFEDSRGLIWIATTDGLNMYNRTTKKFRIFKIKDGLPSNFVLTIIEDNNNNIWVSTANGLSNLIITKNVENKENIYTFKNYDLADGLQGNEFNEKAAFKTHKGELIFGGPNGFNLFYPEDIHPFNVDAKIVFTDFQVFNKSLSNKTPFSNRAILQKSITYTPEITLKYKENVFTIEFSSLNFFHPERREYKYQLENFNNEWYLTNSSNRKITYTNLDPGKYIFRVKATNNDGSWSDQEAILVIRILTPWWNTLLFKIFLALSFISLLFLFYYFRFYKLKEQKTKLEQKVIERTSELTEANTILEERQEEISIQNEELAFHRNQLEKTVEERTTALEKALKRAEESDHLKSAFLANMSHEIRTPMNAIVGFSYLLRDNSINLEEKNEYIDIINKNCESLLVLINDILDISKIEANQIDYVKQYFDIIPLLEELENFYNLHKKEGLEIKFIRNENSSSLILNSDVIRLRQVFQNLIDNAFKFTEKGYIHFGYDILPDKIKFYVSDTGIGIKEEDFGKIFNSFNKLDTGNTKLYRGAGLGLAISRKIVEMLDGDIWLNSKLNVGTSFFFTVPYESKLVKTADSKPEAIKHLIYQELEILVAEDEPANFRLIEKILKNSKVKIVWAQNGKEAVDFVQNNSYSNLLVLMDIKMPIMDGIEALRKIKEFNKTIPVIAVTAYAFENEKAEILKNDFNDYISKPLKPSDLLEIIEKNIGRSIR